VSESQNAIVMTGRRAAPVAVRGPGADRAISPLGHFADASVPALRQPLPTRNAPAVERPVDQALAFQTNTTIANYLYWD